LMLSAAMAPSMSPASRLASSSRQFTFADRSVTAAINPARMRGSSSAMSCAKSRAWDRVGVIAISAPYDEAYSRRNPSRWDILHRHYMNRHTIHNERIARSITHLRRRADSLPIGGEDDGSAHFHADQLFADATDSAPQRLGRCRGYGRIPRVGAGRAGLAGQDNRALPQPALASRGQQLFCHLAHFAVEV